MRRRESVRLPAEAASAGEARRLLRAVLTATDRLDCADAAELACTELVSNAVLHAHSAVEVTIEVGTDVRVEVRDFSFVLPTQRDYGTQATTGRGLALVAALTDEHGVTAADLKGKTVWFRVGGQPPEHSPEEILAPWGDADWDPDMSPRTAVPTPASTAAPTETVRLLGLPPTLWLAAHQHHDTLLRELVLYRAAHGVPDVDLEATDRVRFAVSEVVDAAVQEAQANGTAVPAVPAGHPSPLPWVPAALDVEMHIPADLAPAFAAKQDALDAAERLARSGQLLARPGLAEVIAVRDWECEQVVAQLAGVAPVPWSGIDDERFISDRVDEAALAVDVSRLDFVRRSTRGVVAADDSNRIVAVSRPFARMAGWRVADLVGRRVVALIPPRLREAHVAGFTRHLSTGEAHVLGVPLTLPVLRADGTEVQCSLLVEEAPASGRRGVYLAWIEPLET